MMKWIKFFTTAYITMSVSIAWAEPMAKVADAEERKRQACIDELEQEMNGLCGADGKPSFSTQAKDYGATQKMLSSKEDRVLKICSYKCPQDLAQQCHDTVKSIRTQLTSYAMGGGSGGGSYGGPTCSSINQQFQALKPKSENDMEKLRMQASTTGCIPYNQRGEFVPGQCPEM